MAIVLAQKYLDLLDEVYTTAAKSSVLDGDNNLVRAGANAGELVIPKVTVDGLSDYDRSNGYETGELSVGWETKAFNYDRGTKVPVDAMDNEESVPSLALKALSTIEKAKAAPELDAFRFAKYAEGAGIKATNAELATGEAVLGALVAATAAMDNESVDENDRILFITPALKMLADNVDTTKSKAIFGRFMAIETVPQGRFYTAIDMKSKSGDSATGYAKNADAKNINFMIISKSAVIQFEKHKVSNILTPDENPDADAYVVRYRSYGIAEVYDNKSKGVYLHASTT